MDRERFQALAEEALAELIAELPGQLDNVAIVVEEWPDAATLRLAGVRSPDQLLGFYHGVPRTERSWGYNLVPPDLISIYAGPIEAVCLDDPEAIAATVRRVLRHEVAHHFGISDDRLREIGQY